MGLPPYAEVYRRGHRKALPPLGATGVCRRHMEIGIESPTPAWGYRVVIWIASSGLGKPYPRLGLPGYITEGVMHEMKALPPLGATTLGAAVPCYRIESPTPAWGYPSPTQHIR